MSTERQSVNLRPMLLGLCRNRRKYPVLYWCDPSHPFSYILQFVCHRVADISRLMRQGWMFVSSRPAFSKKKEGFSSRPFPDECILLRSNTTCMTMVGAGDPMDRVGQIYIFTTRRIRWLMGTTSSHSHVDQADPQIRVDRFKKRKFWDLRSTFTEVSRNIF